MPIIVCSNDVPLYVDLDLFYVKVFLSLNAVIWGNMSLFESFIKIV